MANPYFQFKQFMVRHDRCAMKVTTDACLFGAWCAEELQQRKVRSLLDIGAGTGLLSLMIAQKNKTPVDAVEIDAEAAAQAIENVQSSAWHADIRVFNKDILDLEEKKYDCIISNPPFYENELRSDSAKKNIAHHSQQLVMQQLIDVIKSRLEDGGLFFLLIPFKRSAEIRGLLAGSRLHVHKSIQVYPSPLQATRLMIMGSNKKGVEETGMINIKNADGYSAEFVALLKDYYLYL